MTICSDRRRRIFNSQSFHLAFRTFGERGFVEKGISIGRYVLMPDHIHLFVSGSSDFDLSQWVRMFKRILAEALAADGHPPEHWQSGFFDHLIRNRESYDQKWAYVWENPVRAGLVPALSEWPWQGELIQINPA